MGLYKQPGSRVWHMSFVEDGKQKRQSTGQTKKRLADLVYSQKKIELEKKKNQPKAQEVPFPEKPDKRVEEKKVFDEVMAKYLEDVTPKKNPNTQRDERSYAKFLLNSFGGLKLDDITPDLIHEAVLEWKKKVGDRTINRRLSLLSVVFTQAIKVWRLCAFNPVSCIKREKESKRVRFFKGKEFEEIFDKLEDWVKPIVLFARNTGLRRANVVNLKWSQVDMENKRIFLDGEEMKSGESLGIPINQTAFKVLEKAEKNRPASEAYVFCRPKAKRPKPTSKEGGPYTDWGVSKAFKRACIDAKHPHYRFHDLRHDFCSQLVQKGVEIFAVKELAGHKDISSTLQYAHLNPDRLREAVLVLDEKKVS